MTIPSSVKSVLTWVLGALSFIVCCLLLTGAYTLVLALLHWTISFITLAGFGVISALAGTLVMSWSKSLSVELDKLLSL